MRKVLMSAANPDGWTLEGLLAQLQVEIKEKDSNLLGDTSELAQAVSSNNHLIVGFLSRAEVYQRASYALMAKKAPDEGPKGKPRIGSSSVEALIDAQQCGATHFDFEQRVYLRGVKGALQYYRIDRVNGWTPSSHRDGVSHLGDTAEVLCIEKELSK